MKTKTNKAIFILALIVSILFLFASCVASNGADSPVYDLEGTTLQTTASTQTLLSLQTAASTEELAKKAVNVPLLTMSTYDEYLSFISSAELPSNFVYFDFIDRFGEFDTLVILSRIESRDYSSYIYGFENGLGLYVYHNRTMEGEIAKEEGYGLTFTSDVNKSDMRIIESGEKKMFLENGFLYTYIQGTLSSIKWQSDGILFVLSGSGNDFEKIPLDSENEASKLFKTETASEVTKKLSEKISATKK